MTVPHHCPWCGLALDELAAFNSHLANAHNRDPDDVDDALGPDAVEAARLVAEKLGVDPDALPMEFDLETGKLVPKRRPSDGPYL